MPVPPRPLIPQLSALALELETERLKLRPFTEGDIDDIWPVVSDPEFPKMMSWAAHTDRSETRARIHEMQRQLAQNTGVVWAVALDGRAIGSIGLEGMAFTMNTFRIDRAELGFWMAPAQQNHGFMTEAANAAVRFGFQSIGLHKITVGCIAENRASKRVIEKLGFRYVGRLEDDLWRDGKWHSQLRYEMTAPEWPDAHTTLRIPVPRTRPD